MSSGWLSRNRYLIRMSYDNVIMSSGWHRLPFVSHPDEIVNVDFPHHAVALQRFRSLWFPLPWLKITQPARESKVPCLVWFHSRISIQQFWIYPTCGCTKYRILPIVCNDLDTTNPLDPTLARNLFQYLWAIFWNWIEKTVSNNQTLFKIQYIICLKIFFLVWKR